MTENEILDVLNDHSVDFMLATDSRAFKSNGVTLLAVHIFASEDDANLVELNFALHDFHGKREADDFSLIDIPTETGWLREAPAHIIRCPGFTLHVAFVFPGITDPYEDVKKRAEVVVMPSGEMCYRMSKQDKLSFIRAFERGKEQN